MMIGMSLFIILGGIVLLYPIVAVSTSYDQWMDDQEQEAFIKKYKQS